MMPKVKASSASKIKSILQDFPGEFIQSPSNELYCNFCSCAVSFDKRFLVDSHRKTAKHKNALDSRVELQIPHTSQTFLRKDNSDFAEAVTKAFLSAGIPLYKLNNKHIKKLLCGNGHSLPSGTACRKTVLKLGRRVTSNKKCCRWQKDFF